MNRDNVNHIITPPTRNQLPIIQRLVEAYKLWHEFLPHVPKDARYTLGTKIDKLLIETAEMIFTASYVSKDKKQPYLQKATARLDLAKFFLQILWEVNAINNKKYIALSEKLDAVGKMLGGWTKGIESKPPAK